MAMATATRVQQIEAEDFGAVLERMADSLARGPYTVPLGECKELTRQNIRDNFTSSASPDGESWPPRKPIKGDDGHPLLMDTGRLLQSATGGGAGNVERVGSHELDYGVDLGAVPYARAHDYGYSPRHLPERHYLGVSEDTIDKFEEVIVRFIENNIF